MEDHNITRGHVPVWPNEWDYHIGREDAIAFYAYPVFDPFFNMLWRLRISSCDFFGYRTEGYVDVRP